MSLKTCDSFESLAPPMKLRQLWLNVVYFVASVCIIVCIKVTPYVFGYGANWRWSTVRMKVADSSVEEELDIFISVKTTLKYHRNRLPDILDTWFNLAPKNIYFVTDADDVALHRKTGGHLINSKCPATHSRQALCCKLSIEYTSYLSSNKSWFCHFDDDNYVNVPRLIETLSSFDPFSDWYIGKSSTSRPVELLYKENGFVEKISFWFATGGAGFCLSRSLATKIAPYAANGKLAEVGEKIRLPDDVTMGFIIERVLGKKLTIVDSFHSHLESMQSIPIEKLSSQVSFSAGGYNAMQKNVLTVDNLFEQLDDPNRFKSLHCLLYPSAEVCSGANRS